jgi:hypothetical protein
VAPVVLTAVGALVVSVTLADVFYTVLFPASGRGPIRRPLARGLDAAFGLVAFLPRRWRRRVLAYAGPVEVATTLLAWFVLLVVGWAAIYRPALGSGVTAATGPTDASWGAALYFSGYTLTTLGLGDVVAVTPAYRLLTIVEAATGFMTFTLVISYFVAVYSTLTSRNSFALALHQRSGRTGRGLDVVAALWHEGPAAAAAHLAEIADELRRLVQTHNSYPVLRSFHYRHEYDALPRMLQTCWETATLLRTSMDPAADRPELGGSSVAEIADSLERLCSPAADECDRPEWWAGEHTVLVDELEERGVPVRRDGAAAYLDARAAWEPALAALARRTHHEWPVRR